MPAPPRGTGLVVLTSGSQQQQQQVPQQQQQSQPPPNAWGNVGSAAPFRTLSDVVKSTPATTLKNVPESPAPTKTSEPKPPMVDYFDFTSWSIPRCSLTSSLKFTGVGIFFPLRKLWINAPLRLHWKIIYLVNFFKHFIMNTYLQVANGLLTKWLLNGLITTDKLITGYLLSGSI